MHRLVQTSKIFKLAANIVHLMGPNNEKVIWRQIKMQKYKWIADQYFDANIWIKDFAISDINAYHLYKDFLNLTINSLLKHV